MLKITMDDQPTLTQMRARMDLGHSGGLEAQVVELGKMQCLLGPVGAGEEQGLTVHQVPQSLSCMVVNQVILVGLVVEVLWDTMVGEVEEGILEVVEGVEGEEEGAM